MKGQQLKDHQRCVDADDAVAALGDLGTQELWLYSVASLVDKLSMKDNLRRILRWCKLHDKLFDYARWYSLFNSVPSNKKSARNHFKKFRAEAFADVRCAGDPVNQIAAIVPRVEEDEVQSSLVDGASHSQECRPLKTACVTEEVPVNAPLSSDARLAIVAERFNAFKQREFERTRTRELMRRNVHRAKALQERRIASSTDWVAFQSSESYHLAFQEASDQSKRIDDAQRRDARRKDARRKRRRNNWENANSNCQLPPKKHAIRKGASPLSVKQTVGEALGVDDGSLEDFIACSNRDAPLEGTLNDVDLDSRRVPRYLPPALTVDVSAAVDFSSSPEISADEEEEESAVSNTDSLADRRSASEKTLDEMFAADEKREAVLAKMREDIKRGERQSIILKAVEMALCASAFATKLLLDITRAAYAVPETKAKVASAEAALIAHTASSFASSIPCIEICHLKLLLAAKRDNADDDMTLSKMKYQYRDWFTPRGISNPDRNPDVMSYLFGLGIHTPSYNRLSVVVGALALRSLYRLAGDDVRSITMDEISKFSFRGCRVTAPMLSVRAIHLKSLFGDPSEYIHEASIPPHIVDSKQCIKELKDELNGCSAYGFPHVPAATTTQSDDEGKAASGMDPKARAIVFHHPGLLVWHRILMALEASQHDVPGPSIFPKGQDGSMTHRDYCDNGTWAVDDSDHAKSASGLNTHGVEHWNALFSAKINSKRYRWFPPAVHCNHLDEDGNVAVRHPVCDWCRRPFPSFVCACCKRNFYCNTSCALNDWGRVTTNDSASGNVTSRQPHCQTCVKEVRPAHKVLEELNNSGEITLFPGFLGPLSVVNARNHFDVLQWINLQHWFGDDGRRFVESCGLPRYRTAMIRLRPATVLYNPRIKLHLDSPVFELAPSASDNEELSILDQFVQLRTSLTSTLCFPDSSDIPATWRMF